MNPTEKALTNHQSPVTSHEPEPNWIRDGVLGAAYTHIWPDGRTDGWKVPARAE